MTCKRCGYCCEHIVYAYANTKQNLEWINARCFKIVDKSDTIILVHVYHPCEQYSKIDGVSSCKIQANKPEACKTYPISLDFELLVKQGVSPVKFLGEQCAFVEEVLKC